MTHDEAVLLVKFAHTIAFANRDGLVCRQWVPTIGDANFVADQCRKLGVEHVRIGRAEYQWPGGAGLAKLWYVKNQPCLRCSK